MRLGQAVAAIEARHRPIANLFGSAIGHELAFTESTMLLECLERLQHFGITALPLHNSVLVPGSEAARTKEVLEEVLRQFLPYGGGAVVSIDTGGRALVEPSRTRNYSNIKY